MVYIKVLTFLILALASVNCDYTHHNEHDDGEHENGHYGFSYAKFSGPVSGPTEEVHYSNGHDHTVDYVAKPDYHFEYGVEDPHTDVKQSRKEIRSGDTVTGEYTVAQSDGKLRLVKYTASPHTGFQAEVFIDGKPLYEDQDKIHQQNVHQLKHYQHHHHEIHENPDEGHDDGNYDESSEY